MSLAGLRVFLLRTFPLLEQKLSGEKALVASVCSHPPPGYRDQAEGGTGGKTPPKRALNPWGSCRTLSPQELLQGNAM